MKNATVINYSIKSKSEFIFRIRPLVNSRSIYSLTKSPIPFNCKYLDDSVILNTGEDVVTIYSDKAKFIKSNLNERDRWYKNFFYEIDSERGEDCIEHNYNPGYFEVKGNGDLDLSIVVSYGNEIFNVRREYEKELKRIEKLVANFFKINKIPEDDLIKWLVIASDKHVVKRYDGRFSIIAGYHWFGEWGRDAMIALPGICLRTGRYDVARSIIKTFLEESKNGIVPNRLKRSEDEKNLYNSVDAGLWLINSLYLYFKETGDLNFVKNNWLKLKSIVNSYLNGKIATVGLDYLIKHDASATWMDVRINNKPVTPRSKAVEVQALWYNALRIMEIFSMKLNDRKAYRTFSFLANRVKENFIKKFWNGKYLNDSENDTTLRPNQIIAISLPFKIVEDKRIVNSIIRAVENRLLTKFGLRTLERDHKNFHPNYRGNQIERDLAYHQGTIWPWLIGEFIKAIQKKKRKEYMKKLVLPFIKRQIHKFGLGTIGELIDGDKPFESRGCISQAWSIGELIEVITLC